MKCKMPDSRTLYSALLSELLDSDSGVGPLVKRRRPGLGSSNYINVNWVDSSTLKLLGKKMYRARRARFFRSFLSRLIT